MKNLTQHLSRLMAVAGIFSYCIVAVYFLLQNATSIQLKDDNTSKNEQLQFTEL